MAKAHKVSVEHNGTNVDVIINVPAPFAFLEESIRDNFKVCILNYSTRGKTHYTIDMYVLESVKLEYSSTYVDQYTPDPVCSFKFKGLRGRANMITAAAKLLVETDPYAFSPPL